jgi:hypothetical protein
MVGLTSFNVGIPIMKIDCFVSKARYAYIPRNIIYVVENDMFGLGVKNVPGYVSIWVVQANTQRFRILLDIWYIHMMLLQKDCTDMGIQCFKGAAQSEKGNRVMYIISPVASSIE